MIFQPSAYAQFQRQPMVKSGKIILRDSTMRDGEQAGVVYSLDQKLELLHAMDEAHVPEIQIYSLRTARTIAEAQIICREPRTFSKIEVMTRGTNPKWRWEQETVLKFGADCLHCTVPSSSRIRGAYGPALPDDKLVERVSEVVHYGKSLDPNKYFNMALMDSSRADRGLLERLVKTAVEAGADQISISDTTGCCSPDMMRGFVGTVRAWIPKEINLCVHIHNDFGLATANCMAAVEAGATMIDTCVNGRGKRAGNADMVQVMMALKAFYGITTDVLEDKAYDLCKLVERLSGIPIPTNAPFIGDLVFADDSESHILANNDDRFAFQGIDPENWGNPRRVLIGPNGGVVAMATKLSQLGLPPQDNETLRTMWEGCCEFGKMLPNGQYMNDELTRSVCEKYIK